jgi:hypothetical protein
MGACRRRAAFSQLGDEERVEGASDEKEGSYLRLIVLRLNDERSERWERSLVLAVKVSEPVDHLRVRVIGLGIGLGLGQDSG